MKFRKKPVIIEAVKFLDKMSTQEAPQWFVQALLKERYVIGSVWRIGDQLRICTLEGEMKANLGDWIIKGVKGELYPCKPDIFAQTYEEVPECERRTTGIPMHE